MSSQVIGAELDRLLQEHATEHSGALPTYIPELGKADPAWFGISLCTIDGSVHETGDSRQEFTIQSVSKPFVFALALADDRPDEVLARVGMEPSGDAFNSILLDSADRPHNPMVNAGAIVTVGLVGGATPSERFDRILRTMSGFAGRDLEVDENVFESERRTGHRNRAIGHLLRTVGALIDDVDDVLEVYFRQCSIKVTSTDLAVMAATLAYGGVNPITGDRVVAAEAVADVLSVMFTAGMYDYSGEWAYRTGLPAKSGVSGGVAALVPGQLGAGVFSPLVDDRGNSVRGVKVCEELSGRLGFHLFRARTEVVPPIRAIGSGIDRRSVRVRSTQQSGALARLGGRIGVVETQGPWSFVACERFMRAVGALSVDAVIVETSRMGFVDTTAAVLMREFIRQAAATGLEVVFAGRIPDGLFELAARRFPTLDEALEWCEDSVLAGLGGVGSDLHEVSLAESDLGGGLDPASLRELAGAGKVVLTESGEVIAKAGAPSPSMFLVTSGHLTATVEGRRVAAFGPGSMIGEMGFLTGEPRSATITADQASTLIEFATFDLLRPELRQRLFRTVATVLASRLSSTTRTLAELTA